MGKNKKAETQPVFGSFLQGYLDRLKNPKAPPLPDLDGLAQSYARAVAPRKVKELSAEVEDLKKTVATLKSRRVGSKREAPLKNIIRHAVDKVPGASDLQIASSVDRILAKAIPRRDFSTVCPGSWRKRFRLPKLMTDALSSNADRILKARLRSYISKAR